MSEPALEILRAQGWRFYTFIGAGGARCMCSWDTDEARVRQLAGDIRQAMTATN
jgi:threonine aldolase